ncbi:A/G-specific adenine glycosylase [Methanoregula sp.]|uniref:A/G-specific adenine glycosylase n=1 Tax=Methanoregula sp. TaxID=2052170 RepID=UPI002CFB604E|nr:A/G-specific adenine glycosylase [Methanoregula sp.]HVP96009.1 A/G-specific adenine glycosylase [Methanoregula sp.]
MKKSTQTCLETIGPAFSRDNLTDEAAAQFRDLVLAFYTSRGRHDMLWRHTEDPYRILVSEIMLQQTRVDRVAIKYPAFVAAFPDAAALARAPLADVLAAWQGMGYNRRAVALKKCAEKMVNEFRGTLPRDPEVLATFPGIGPATASSICAFAYNLPVIFIETNIRRVFIHFFFADAEAVTDAEILPLVERTLDRRNPRAWYWALMDLGTELKKSVPNPNRRSTAYVKQAPFAGSDRRIRGLILKYVIGNAPAREQAIISALTEEPARVRRILAALQNEGFLRKGKDGYRIAE